MGDKLPTLPESSWDGDSSYTWLGEPFEYTRDDIREYGRKCYEAGKRTATPAKGESK